VTGSFAYAWGLSYKGQASGFAGQWPFDPKGAFDLDATCPVRAQGHDGDAYFQIGISVMARNTLHFHAQVGAQVWCCWQDLGSYDLDFPFGSFPFDGNLLFVDAASTDARGVTIRGEARLQMPLAFPTPSVVVGNFTWILEDACNTSSLAQTVGVYLNNAGGYTTPLRGQITVTTSPSSIPCKVESIPPADANGIAPGPSVWILTVAAQDVPAAGGAVTVSVATNAGSPPFPSGQSVSLPLAPVLTDAATLQMKIAAVAACESAKHAGYVKKFVPDPPEEIVWWGTQELLLVPPSTRAGAPVAVVGPATRVAVAKSGLVAAMREQKSNPHGVVQRNAIAADGVRVVVRRVELTASGTARTIR
jgi:hypothetical protein